MSNYFVHDTIYNYHFVNSSVGKKEKAYSEILNCMRTGMSMLERPNFVIT